jgi:hypothetical protein
MPNLDANLGQSVAALVQPTAMNYATFHIHQGFEGQTDVKHLLAPRLFSFMIQ